MLRYFAEYYRPTEEQLVEMWGEALFSLDANVLLNFYRIGDRAQEDFFRVLERLQSRLFLAYQAAKGYHE